MNSVLTTPLVKPCYSHQRFVDEFFGLTREVQFNSELKAFVVITNAEGSFDCQIIGVLCDDHTELVGKTLQYSGRFLEYHGSYVPAVGGNLCH